jgi:hypothetical protein
MRKSGNLTYLNWKHDAKSPDAVMNFISGIGRKHPSKWQTIGGFIDACRVGRKTPRSGTTKAEWESAEASRKAQQRFCDFYDLRQFSVAHKGHYCVHSIEACPYRQEAWRLGPPVTVRSDSEFSPERYADAERTNEILRAWLTILLDVRRDGGLPAATANAVITDRHWEVVDALAEAEWPRMAKKLHHARREQDRRDIRNKLRQRAQMQLAECIAAGADAMKRAEREGT